MCTRLVNYLVDWACPVKMWLGKLTMLDMTPLVWLGHKTSTQTNTELKVKDQPLHQCILIKVFAIYLIISRLLAPKNISKTYSLTKSEYIVLAMMQVWHTGNDAGLAYLQWCSLAYWQWRKSGKTINVVTNMDLWQTTLSLFESSCNCSTLVQEPFQNI